MKNLITILIFLALFFSPLSYAQQNESSVSANVIKVNYLPNIRDRIFEKFFAFFKFSDKDKLKYQLDLLDTRLGEIKFVVESNKGDLIEESSSRYSTYLNRISDLIEKGKDDINREEIVSQLKSHQSLLTELQKKYEFESGFWILLQHDINTLNNVISVISTNNK